MRQNAEEDAWLGQLQSGLLSPGRYFAGVQELPPRSRPRAVQMMLNSLSGDQIYALLSAAARGRFEGHSRTVSDADDQDQHTSERENTELLRIVVRCAPSLPGFRDIRLEDLLCHPGTPAETEGWGTTVLALLINHSPAADDVVAAFCDAGGDTFKQLLKW